MAGFGCGAPGSDRVAGGGSGAAGDRGAGGFRRVAAAATAGARAREQRGDGLRRSRLEPAIGAVAGDVRRERVFPNGPRARSDSHDVAARDRGFDRARVVRDRPVGGEGVGDVRGHEGSGGGLFQGDGARVGRPGHPLQLRGSGVYGDRDDGITL